MSDNNPDSLVLKEEDNGTPEQFNEAVSAAGRQAWWAVATATTKNSTTANWFSAIGSIIVQQINQK